MRDLPRATGLRDGAVDGEHAARSRPRELGCSGAQDKIQVDRIAPGSTTMDAPSQRQLVAVQRVAGITIIHGDASHRQTDEVVVIRAVRRITARQGIPEVKQVATDGRRLGAGVTCIRGPARAVPIRTGRAGPALDRLRIRRTRQETDQGSGREGCADVIPSRRVSVIHLTILFLVARCRCG